MVNVVTVGYSSNGSSRSIDKRVGAVVSVWANAAMTHAHQIRIAKAVILHN
ncbi:hypothetical protein L0664_13165 [Octadecabacter sp. G9-8]|uniref:Uncharacterized protein n=1 Tax=Octadecabacter dasysiphoniae TaxID=2909341 RepID=A0ABS9CYY9_9RHOB|nr:hypothetical protein [Octadecabacter dasysiphoniae]MCF2872019.1 hypothetical protein [Octadecabacter dasysiphoniae]